MNSPNQKVLFIFSGNLALASILVDALKAATGYLIEDVLAHDLASNVERSEKDGQPACIVLELDTWSSPEEKSQSFIDLHRHLVTTFPNVPIVSLVFDNSNREQVSMFKADHTIQTNKNAFGQLVSTLKEIVG